jgi:hypothetical protein
VSDTEDDAKAWRAWAEKLANDLEMQTDADDFPPEQWDDSDLREGIRAALMAAVQVIEALTPLVPPDSLPMVLQRRH